ncbi:MAG: hypothetical protein AB7K37_06610 [Cyclobacteriaceae bacterium]
MRNILITIGLCTLISIVSAGQTLFKDAELIYANYRKDVVSPDFRSILPILAKYSGRSNRDVSFASLREAYSKNKYISALLNSYKVKIDGEVLKILKQGKLDSARVANLRDLTIEKRKLDSMFSASKSYLTRIRVRGYYAAVKEFVVPGIAQSLDSTGMVIYLKTDSSQLETRLKEVDAKIKTASSELQKALDAQKAAERIVESLKSVVDGKVSIESVSEFRAVLDPTSTIYLTDHLSGSAETTISQIKVSFSGISQSTLIDGASTFIANRIKQEMKAEFFYRFGDLFKGDQVREISKLFPTTVKLWKSIDHYDQSTFINLLRVAFREDLSGLFFQIPAYLEGRNLADPELMFLVVNTVKSIKSIHSGSSPIATIDQLQVDLANNSQSYKVASAIRYLQIISSSLMEDGQGQGVRAWLTSDRFLNMRNNGDQAKIFLGLIYQRILQHNDLNRSQDVSGFFANIETLYSDYPYFLRTVNTFYRITQTVDDLYESLIIRRKTGQSLSNDDFIQYQLASFDFVRFSIERFGTKFQYQTVKGESISYDLVIGSLQKIYRSCLSNDHASTIFHTFNLLNDMMKSDSSYQTIKSGLNTFLKYGSFVAEIAAATSAEDVSKAIDAIALPVGSYGIKRKSKFNVALNAYPGIVGGFEQLRPDGNKFVGNLGFTAPIGFAFSWGVAKKLTEERKARFGGHKKYSLDGSKFFTYTSFTIFATIFDLGAPVLYRLSSSEGFPEEVRFAQFVSPGVSFIYGLRNTSVSIIGGAQITPELRSFTAGERLPVLRYQMGVVMDLPLFNLKTKG